jgi:hypothetical protein
MKNLTKFFILLTTGILLINIINVSVMAQKIKENNPLPAEFVQKIDRIALNKNIRLLEPTFLTSPTIYGAGIVTYAIAKKVLDNLEKEVAVELPPAKDTLLIKEAAYKAFHNVITEQGSLNSKNDFILNITIIDHGFEWATSWAMGVYIHLKVDLVSSTGDKIWEQVYFMDKNEKAKPYNKKAMSARAAIRGLVKDYKDNPDLLPETYELICQILASKFIPTQK